MFLFDSLPNQIHILRTSPDRWTARHSILVLYLSIPTGLQLFAIGQSLDRNCIQSLSNRRLSILKKGLQRGESGTGACAATLRHV